MNYIIEGRCLQYNYLFENIILTKYSTGRPRVVFYLRIPFLGPILKFIVILGLLYAYSLYKRHFRDIFWSLSLAYTFQASY